MDNVKIAFVGVGGMGQCAHLANYTDLPGCEVVALAEIRQEMAKRVAARYAVPRVYKDHTELLANEKVDAIVAPQPFNRHGVLLKDLFLAGVPVLTEKPLTCSPEAGEKILAALAASPGAKHYLGYHKRSDPATMYAINKIAKLKENGEIGPLQYVRIIMPAGDWVANGFTHLIGSDEPMPPLEWDPLPSDLSPANQEAYTGFVNYYIHQVNLMRHFLGENYTVSYVDPAERMFVVHGESGVTGVIEMSPYHTTIAWHEEVMAAFAKGFIKVSLPAPLASNRPGDVVIYKDPGDGQTPKEIRPQLPWVHAMRQQAINFVAAVRGESTPLCQAAEAMEDLKAAREYLRLLKGC